MTVASCLAIVNHEGYHFEIHDRSLVATIMRYQSEDFISLQIDPTNT